MGIEISGICTLLQVFDMPRSLSFYRDRLGFEVAAASSPGDDCGWCLLRANGHELMLNAMYEPQMRPATPEPGRTVAHGDTALFIGCERIDEAYAYLRACGIPAQPPVVRDYGMKQVAFLDPDGYNICLQWPAA